MTDDREEVPVTADHPDSPFHATGTDHITLIGSNEADTIEFYRDVRPFSRTALTLRWRSTPRNRGTGPGPSRAGRSAP